MLYYDLFIIMTMYVYIFVLFANFICYLVSVVAQHKNKYNLIPFCVFYTLNVEVCV